MVTEELLKKVIDFIDIEQRSGSMQIISPIYIARCMQIDYEDAVDVVKILNNK